MFIFECIWILLQIFFKHASIAGNPGEQTPQKNVVGVTLIGWGGENYSYFKEQSEGGFQSGRIWMKLESFKSWLWRT